MTDSIDPIRLLIPFEVWVKMMQYVQACPVEINGFGMMTQRGNTLTVDNVFILAQDANPAGVETDQEALSQFMFELIRDGGDPGKMTFQWHSHVNMDTYFSSTDTDNINRWPGTWLISLVANKRGEYRCRLDTYKPFRQSMELKPEIFYRVPEDQANMIVAEVDNLVKHRGAWGPNVPPVAVPLPVDNKINIISPTGTSRTKKLLSSLKGNAPKPETAVLPEAPPRRSIWQKLGFR